MTRDSNPFRSLERQLERMQRQIEEFVGVDPFESGIGPTTMGVDLADRGEEFVLTADVPGFEKDDIDLRLLDDTLQIMAEREDENVDEEGDVLLRSERKQRSLSRSVTLPASVDEEAIAATYKNGVLTVTIPKAEPETVDGKEIDID